MFRSPLIEFVEDHERGLVVVDEELDLRPTYAVHGPSRRSGPQEWSLEAVNPVQVDKGLHTTFFISTDGYGNGLSQAQKNKFGRLRRRHKRFQMESDRAIRLNEGFRDIGLIGGNLALPGYVVKQAGRYLKQGAVARLPARRMSWEALAGGAVVLAAREAGYERPPREVAMYAKSTYERLCAAARKLRCKLGLDVPPIREGIVDAILEELDEREDLDGKSCEELAQVGHDLLELADKAGIGPGTPRVTVAAAARVTEEKHLTQAQVVDAASPIVETTTSKIGRYSQEIVGVYED
jgi:transcription initiation factor TFIIB